MNLTRKVLTLIPAVLIAAPSVPLAASAADSQIEAHIKSSFNFKQFLSRDDLSIACSDGVVTLSGKVHEEYHKTLAEATAVATPGVKSVKNQIQVTADPLPEHSDGWITLKVKAALSFHKIVSATATEVTTQDGVVTLKGKAESQAQKDMTAMYARDVDGVKDVVNQMTLGGGGGAKAVESKVDDASVTAQIKTSLMLHRSTHLLSARIETRDGVVTVQGEARSEAEKELVGKIVADTNGVKRVDNRMIVKP